MRLILLSPDLMLMSAAHGVAQRQGASLQSVGDAAAATAACADPEVRLLAVDLRTPGLDIGSLVAAVRSARSAAVHILAGGPHVHTASLAAAHAAGCDEIVTRGEFESRLAAALARLAD